jgi:AcrR family transcriptional regulator
LTTPRAISRRSDARRNDDRLLAAADEAFRAAGVNASLEGIAKSAGVAVGTLYAHFRTRDGLLAALLADRVDRLAAHGQQLLKTQSPQRALWEWLDAYAGEVAAYQGLPDSVIRTLHDPDSGLTNTCDLMRRTCAKLLRRAQRAGQARSDIAVDEVLAMAAAVAGAAAIRGHQPDRFVAVLATGLMASPEATSGERADDQTVEAP